MRDRSLNRRRALAICVFSRARRLPAPTSRAKATSAHRASVQAPATKTGLDLLYTYPHTSEEKVAMAKPVSMQVEPPKPKRAKTIRMQIERPPEI